MSTNEPLIDERDCAAILNLSVGWLRLDRQRPQPTVPFYKFPSGSVRYHPARVRQALDAIERGGPVAAVQA